MPLPESVQLYDLLDISQWAQQQNNSHILRQEVERLLNGKSNRFPAQNGRGRIEQAGAVCAFAGHLDRCMINALIKREPALVASFYDHDELTDQDRKWLEHRTRQILKQQDSHTSQLPSQQEYLKWVLYPLKQQLERGRATQATQNSLLKFLELESWQDTARLPRWGQVIYQQLFPEQLALEPGTQQILLEKLERRWQNESTLTKLGQILLVRLLASTSSRPSPGLFIRYLKQGNPTPAQIKHVLAAHPEWLQHEALQDHLLSQTRLKEATSTQLVKSVKVKKLPQALRHLTATNPQQARKQLAALAGPCLQWLPRQQLLPLMQAPDRHVRRQTLRLLQQMPDGDLNNIFRRKVYDWIGNMPPRIRYWWSKLPFPTL